MLGVSATVSTVDGEASIDSSLRIKANKVHKGSKSSIVHDASSDSTALVEVVPDKVFLQRLTEAWKSIASHPRGSLCLVTSDRDLEVPGIAEAKRSSG